MTDKQTKRNIYTPLTTATRAVQTSTTHIYIIYIMCVCMKIYNNNNILLLCLLQYTPPSTTAKGTVVQTSNYVQYIN